MTRTPPTPTPGAPPDVEPADQLYLRESGLIDLIFRLFTFSLQVEGGFHRTRQRLDRDDIACLALIAGGNARAPADLARALGLSRQSACRKAARLVSLGLVTSGQDSEDRRRHRLAATGQGDRALSRGFSASRRRTAQAFADARPEDVAGFLRVTRLLARPKKN